MFDRLDRRQFLGRGAAASAAAAFAVQSVSCAADESPSEKIVVGVMGLSRGRSLAVSFAKAPNVEVKYVCDVDKSRAQAGASSLSQLVGKDPEVVTDFRKILDDADVDVLVCAAPNHWHAPATILSCKAGKHVYVEKPCCHNPAEGELMVQAARKYNKAVQMGSQRRSGPTYMEGIRSLLDPIDSPIGRVYLARAYYANLRPSIGKTDPSDPPANIDYELWQGPAPRMPYKSNVVHYNWHWWWHWGNGELGNNGIHSLDVCRWGMGLDLPVRVTSSGGRYHWDDEQQTPDTHTVCYEFEDGKQVTWQGTSCNRHGGGFVEFLGTEGTMVVDGGGGYTVYDRRDKEVRREKGTVGQEEHVANLLKAIRNDTPLKLNAEIEEGHKSTLLCHLGNIAQRTGRTLNCDPTNGHIKDDADAMKLWGRDYEDGWAPTI